MKTYYFIIPLLICFKAFSQNASEIQKTKMKEVSTAWVGTWYGEGWMILPDGKKHFFVQEEVITSKLQGAVLTIDGKGKDKETGQSIHDAVGFITFDIIKQQYRFTAMNGKGYITDVVPEVNKNGGIVWYLQMPGSIIRFTISFMNKEWLETGEISKDNGVTWENNFEMKLKKL